MEYVCGIPKNICVGTYLADVHTAFAVFIFIRL